MKTKKIKSAIPIYGAALVWLLLGVICPTMLLKLWFLLIAAVLSAAAYFVLSKVFKGREVQVRESANSGDKGIDALIEDGRLDAFVKDRYSSYTTGIGAKIRSGETTLAELAAYAEEMGAPQLPGSGRQEYLQSIVNSILFGG